MTRFVALLRAVNVGGRKVEMEPLRALATKLGFEDVATYIASGNLVFTVHGAPKVVAAELEAAIAARFKLEVPVILRTATLWERYLECPFPDAAASEPNRVMLALAKTPPRKEAPAELLARAKHGESIVLQGDALWIHYPAGQAKTKLTPASVDKAMGSATTARNLNTVRTLATMANRE
ncbi:MAG: DUF1697 domain-containing protein [Candidatus Thermoplasmatota archaeon]